MEYKELTQQAVNGELNPLTLYIEFKKQVDELTECIKTLQPLATDEALKYPEKTFKFNGVTVEKRNAACTWDYSNVEIYFDLKNRLKYVEKIAQAGGGFDDSGNEIGKAIKVEGKQIIAIKL